MNNKILFVEEGHNTSYINSLLIGLFYNSSIISTKLLDADPINSHFIYLQEIIKNNFVEPIRKNISITANVTNEIRNFCCFSGFSKNITEKHNVIDYLDFIVENVSPISLIGPHIHINLEKSEDNADIKTLLKKRMSESFTKEKHNMHNIYMVPIYIDRFFYGTKTNVKIDIKRKIMLDESNYRWNIHCIICHNGKNLIDGYYYAIIFVNNKWIIFDDTRVPSFENIDMTNTCTVEKIMSECILVIYKMI